MFEMSDFEHVVRWPRWKSYKNTDSQKRHAIIIVCLNVRFCIMLIHRTLLNELETNHFLVLTQIGHIYTQHWHNIFIIGTSVTCCRFHHLQCPTFARCRWGACSEKPQSISDHDVRPVSISGTCDSTTCDHYRPFDILLADNPCTV